MNEIKDLLYQLRVRPNKDRGQNFLIVPSVINEIVEFANPQKHEQLLEIGPGLGALTAELADHENLIVVEIEEKFCEHLRKKFPNLIIVNEDVRFIDFEELIKENDFDLAQGLTVFGNLPYSFSSDIIFHLLTFAKSVNRSILMLQKEFAARLAAKVNTKAYGSLSIFTQIKADTLLGPIISGDCFHPEAKVESQVIELRFFKEPKYQINDDLLFRQVVLAMFSERRKKITNTLKKLKAVTIENPKEFLVEHNFNPDARPENLSVEDYVRLSNIISTL